MPSGPFIDRRSRARRTDDRHAVYDLIGAPTTFCKSGPVNRVARFILLLVVGLGVLTWIADGVLSRTTRKWFEADIRLRSQLAVAASRHALIDHIRAGDRDGLRERLREITRDERIIGAVLCTPDGTSLAQTEDVPAAVNCQSVRAIRGDREIGGLSSLHAVVPNGPVNVTAVSVADGSEELAFAVLVHDLGHIERRETKIRRLLLLGFAVLSVAASVLTLVSAQLAWAGWIRELRAALQGKAKSERYRPVLGDVRALVERLSAERTFDAQASGWTPDRLRSSLERFLHGERVVILANREPYIHERNGAGGIDVKHPASGLVTALEPVMRACSGVWVAHGSGSADREVADRKGHVLVPPGEESYQIRRVWLDEAEEQGYYYGFSNEGLWPLCHVAHARPVFRSEDWEHYRRVNQKFADAVCDEVDSDDPIILVQDYHFALAPAMIRKRLPRATIITFWHIPWPNAERFGICPWRDEILEGLLGSSILGFHTQQHCNNFLEAIDSFVESRIDREQNSVVLGARRTMVRPYPISIEWPVHWLDQLPEPAECRKDVFRELGLPANALLGVGVDRLDYTKGIEERLLAVERLLERHPHLRGRFAFAQLAAPSRTKIDRYRELNDAVEKVAERINTRFGTDRYRPIILLREHHEPPRVFRFLRAADLCYVSSLHDGMNLVAKEFVAARSDELGVLVLSQFTGAARELTEALIVNPYNLDEASDAMATALAMPPSEQRARMQSMQTLVAQYNVYRWAGRMLIDAAELRRRERLNGRLTPAALLETA